VQEKYLHFFTSFEASLYSYIYDKFYIIIIMILYLFLYY